MKAIKLLPLVVVALLGVSGVAHAEEYVCKVYCSGGTTSAVVNASSSSDAASKINPQPVADQVCRDAGYSKATTGTMSPSQCAKK